MLSFKVLLKDAEKAKKALMEKGMLSKNLKVIKSKEHIFFPVTIIEKDLLMQFSGSKFVRKPFKQREIKEDYKEILYSVLTEEELKILPTSYDIIGDIIIIEINKELVAKEQSIAEALLRTHKSIHVILKKSGIHEGEFRTQKLSHLAGENRKETIYKENNVRIELDVERVYFSPRLSTERKRIYKQVKPNETILVMFSGCGPYPLVISKNTKAKTIIGIEKNQIAHNYALQNLSLNKIKNVMFLCGDVKEKVPELNQKFNRIVMPLPKGAENFLDLAFGVSRKGTIIHFYDFEHETEIDQAADKIQRAANKSKVKYSIHSIVKCGQYSPGKYRLCVDFEII